MIGFFSIYIFLWLVALFILDYFFIIRPRGKEERCSAKTEGTVIRYTRYEYNDMRLPVAEYTVDGISYTVAGPKFRAVVNMPGFASPDDIAPEEQINLGGDELPEDLIIRPKKTSRFTYSHPTIASFYPVGTKVDIYYNPRNPKEAFVERYAGYPKIIGVILIAATVILAILLLTGIVGSAALKRYSA